MSEALRRVTAIVRTLTALALVVVERQASSENVTPIPTPACAQYTCKWDMLKTGVTALGDSKHSTRNGMQETTLLSWPDWKAEYVARRNAVLMARHQACAGGAATYFDASFNKQLSCKSPTCRELLDWTKDIMPNSGYTHIPIHADLDTIPQPAFLTPTHHLTPGVPGNCMLTFLDMYHFLEVAAYASNPRTSTIDAIGLGDIGEFLQWVQNVNA